MDRTFGYRLRLLRSDKGLTASELGKLINTPRGTIAHWEAGDFYPNNDRLVALADIFNVSVDFLLGRTDCKMPISVLTASGEQVVDLNEFNKEQQELIKSLVVQFKK